MIAVEVKSSEWGDYTKAFAAGQFGMFLLGWFPDFVDPDNFLAPWLTESPEVLGTYLNKATGSVDKGFYAEFQKLLGDAKKTPNQATRAEAYKKAQQTLADSAILVPLWQNLAQSYVIAQKNVKGDHAGRHDDLPDVPAVEVVDRISRDGGPLMLRRPPSSSLCSTVKRL